MIVFAFSCVITHPLASIHCSINFYISRLFSSLPEPSTGIATILQGKKPKEKRSSVIFWKWILWPDHDLNFWKTEIITRYYKLAVCSTEKKIWESETASDWANNIQILWSVANQHQLAFSAVYLFLSTQFAAHSSLLNTCLYY